MFHEFWYRRKRRKWNYWKTDGGHAGRIRKQRRVDSEILRHVLEAERPRVVAKLLGSGSQQRWLGISERF